MISMVCVLKALSVWWYGCVSAALFERYERLDSYSFDQSSPKVLRARISLDGYSLSTETLDLLHDCLR